MITISKDRCTVVNQDDGQIMFFADSEAGRSYCRSVGVALPEDVDSPPQPLKVVEDVPLYDPRKAEGETSTAAHEPLIWFKVVDGNVVLNARAESVQKQGEMASFVRLYREAKRRGML